jgi:hypothetical protein
MKACFTLLLFIIFCKVTLAQTPMLGGKPGDKKVILICTPSRASLIGQEPLYVLKTHGKELRSKYLKLNSINPQQIKSLSVLKDSSVTKKYGQEAKYGVVEITLDDEKYPDAYKWIQIDSGKKTN